MKPAQQLAEVKAHIGVAIVGRPPTDEQQTLGDIRLLPHQMEAERRVLQALRRFEVALLADEVGMGKTYVALSVARRYERVTILAPASLVPMWREAIVKAHVAHVQVTSLHRFSRGTTTRTPAPVLSLVVIDEAHYLRTPNTNRFRAVADFVVGAHVLLMSATPLHNESSDLRAMLSLVRGARQDALGDDVLAQLVIRQPARRSVPAIREHAPISIPHDRALLDALLALPAPLPARDGSVAGALIRLGLLRAWCSSDAALEHTLRRRILRGEALKHALEAGKHPTANELRSWMIGEREVQLAFPELLVDAKLEGDALRPVLDRHVDALRDILSQVRRADNGDAHRVHALRAIIQAHPDTPIVAFSQLASTVHALYRALSDIAGVGAVSGSHARIASGRITRQEAINAFAPIAQGKPPPPHHARIQLLLSTDLLAEGVNLQDAGVVVHLDMPWTDALLTQRVGRCARLGSSHKTLHVYRIAPLAVAERVLQLQRRVSRKASRARRLVGDSTSHASSAADHASRLNELLRSWVDEQPAGVDDRAVGTAGDASDSASPTRCRSRVAAVSSEIHGFLALLHDGRDMTLVCAVHTNVRTARAARPAIQSGMDTARNVWRLSRSPRRLAAIVETISRASLPVRVEASTRRAAARIVRRYIARQQLYGDLDVGSVDAPRAWLRAQRRLASGLSRSSATHRPTLAVAVCDARAMLARTHGATVELALERWNAEGEHEAFVDWASGWRRHPALNASLERTDARCDTTGDAPADDRQCVAIILLQGANFHE